MFEPKRLQALLKKYDVPGPRYTSYPTVPAWTTDIGKDQYQESLAKLKSGEHLSLYFHLPFCENLCHFCGCTQVITKDHSRSSEYVGMLLKELELINRFIPKNCREVTQLHFGGGSPNFLQPEELSQIMKGVRSYFTLVPDAEIAIEMHPRTSTNAFCKNLKPQGFNRISLGVQDLDPKVQTLINRRQTYEMTKAMVDELRSFGFDSFNFDLVYGLPGQNIEGWNKTLKQVIEMRPNRLAMYSYAHVPWVRPVQRTFADSDLPTPSQKLQFFEMGCQRLMQSGYSLIGMDHFALQDDDLSLALKTGGIHRNFMGYSTRADAHQIGFGMSSISYVAGNYFQNKKELKNYYSSLVEEKLATFRGIILNREDAIRRDWIIRIMCRTSDLIPPFEKKWKINFKDYFKEDLPHLQNFVDDDLLDWDETRFEVKGEGGLFLRNMAMVFDRYLSKIREQAKNPTFSRTI